MVTEEKQIGFTACNHKNIDFKNIALEELEHIASCEICAAQYAGFIEKQAMIKAPHYLKDNILKKSRAFSGVWNINKHIRLQMSWKRLQMFCYGMKIGLAMCGALAILFLVPVGDSQQKEPAVGVNFIDKMNRELREFSDNVLEYTDLLVLNSDANNKEDISHDKEKE